MARFTENGFEIDDVVAIRNRLTTKAQEVFAPILNGEELSTDDSGVLGRIFGIVAEPIYDQEIATQDFIMSLNPNNANETLLDDFLALNGEMRLDSRPATAPLMLFGTIGGSVDITASARSDITGDTFRLLNAVTFNNDECNGVEFLLDEPTSQTTYTLNYAIEGKESVNPPISIISLDGETLKDVSARMMQTINSQTSDLQATLTKDNRVNVYIMNRFDVGSFYVSNNITIESSYNLVDAQSVTYTAVEQAANTITKIASGSSTAWISVTNPYNTYPSSPVENDADARWRWYITKAKDGYGEYDHLYGSLMRLNGVRFINIQQNISKTNGIRVNQGISVFVLGGDPNTIAKTIFDNIGIGTATNGDLRYYANDLTGSPHPIYFSRPSYAEIQISFSIKSLPNFPTNGKNTIKQRIVDWFNNLEVGEDILYSRLFDPINSVQGFSAKNLQIGRVGGNIGTNDITIKFSELATIKPENILIGGS